MVSMRRPAAPPVFTPTGFGLLSVAEMATDGDGHWRNGAEYEPLYCGTALNTAAVCVTGGVTKPALSGARPTVGADPFAVYAWLDCSPIGYTPDDWRRLTVAALVNNEAAAVEAVFATGLVTGGTVYPHLAATAEVVDGGLGGVGQQVRLQPAATVLAAGAAVDIVEAVGLLEGAMGGCYGGTPTLHVPRAVVPHMAAYTLITASGGRLRTTLGSLVAAGGGYPGTAPAGTPPAPGTAWLYATGAVKVWRSQVELTGRDPAEWVGRARNDQVLIAERVYVIGWDCCLFAVQVSLGGVTTGAAGAAT